MAEEHDPLATFERKLAELRALFVGGLPDRIRLLRDSEAGDDPAARSVLRVEAHKIAGTAGSHGFAELSEVARALEGAVLDGAAPESVRARTRALLAACEAVVGASGSGDVAVPADTRTETPSEGAHTPTILVVDDEATARLLALTLTRLGGYATTIAGSGSAALALLDGRSFDLVLCDAMMPDLDGPSFVREVRRTKPTYARTPIVICSAASRDELATTFDPPADGWLRKPILPSRLLAELAPFLAAT